MTLGVIKIYRWEISIDQAIRVRKLEAGKLAILKLNRDH